MPMDYAIRTSRLSNSWRHLCKFNLVICFPSRPVSSTILMMDYSFINRYLSLHKATKLRKSIVIGVVSLLWQPNVHDWIHFTITRRVQSLEIYLSAEVLPYTIKLPDSFYYNYKCTRSITHLALTKVELNPLHKGGSMGHGFLQLS